jgi:hypothetical protein
MPAQATPETDDAAEKLARGKHLVASLVEAWEGGDLAHAVNQLRDWAGIQS